MAELLWRVERELEAGIFPDLKGRASPLWIDGANVYFNDAGTQAGLGRYPLFVPTDSNPVLGTHTTAINGTKTVFYGTKTKLYKWTEAGGLVDVTRLSGPYTGTNDDLWSITSWGDWIYATNGVDTPQLFKTTVFADGTGLGSVTTAKIVVERSPFAALFNTNVFDKDINWCDDDDIENYVSAEDNMAGRLTARGLSSEIKAAKRLGPEIAFYSTDELRKFEFIGAPLAFGIQSGVPGIGAVGINSVCAALAGIHYGFGPRGIWRSDGSQGEILSQGIVHKYVYENINRSYWHKVVAMHDQAQNMVVFFYPSTDSTVNDRGVGYNYKNKSWTLFNYGYSSASDTGVFDYAIAGDEFGNIWAHGVIGAPPIVGTNNEISVEQTEATIVAGYGDIGYGEGGYGGEDIADG